MPEGLLCLAGNGFLARELYHSVGDLSQQELKMGSGVNPRLESLGYREGRGAQQRGMGTARLVEDCERLLVATASQWRRPGPAWRCP